MDAPFCILLHLTNKCSTEPFAATKFPAALLCNVPIIFISELKGISPSRSYCFFISSELVPDVLPKLISAISTGSPNNLSFSSSFFAVALLHKAPINFSLSKFSLLFFMSPLSNFNSLFSICTFISSAGKEKVSTWIVFSVRVPVLSVKITLVLPNVSTAESFFTIAFLLAISNIP